MENTTQTTAKATTKKMNLIQKLSAIQTELKAPKNLYNSFGKYSYRNAEGILESAKPLLAKHGLSLVVSDTMELIGEARYVKATATVYDLDSDKTLSATAYARESDDKKGMDASQITGATSSYARKYALNGLFLLDDTKDADTDEYAITNGASKSEARKSDLQTDSLAKPETKSTEKPVENSVGVVKENAFNKSKFSAFKK